MYLKGCIKIPGAGKALHAFKSKGMSGSALVLWYPILLNIIPQCKSSYFSVVTAVCFCNKNEPIPAYKKKTLKKQLALKKRCYRLVTVCTQYIWKISELN